MSYTFLKRNVFNLDLKRLTSEQARISKGSLKLHELAFLSMRTYGLREKIESEAYKRRQVGTLISVFQH